MGRKIRKEKRAAKVGGGVGLMGEGERGKKTKKKRVKPRGKSVILYYCMAKVITKVDGRVVFARFSKHQGRFV